MAWMDKNKISKTDKDPLMQQSHCIRGFLLSEIRLGQYFTDSMDAILALRPQIAYPRKRREGGEAIMGHTGRQKALIQAGRAFVLVLLAGLILAGCAEWSRIQQERDRMSYIAGSIGSETYELMLSEMSKTRVLEAYLIQTGGDYSGFGEVSHILLQEDYVRNVLFAPDGIVGAVFPLEGNESVIGLDMYGDGAGNLEAQAAIEKEELYIAGPFA